MFEQMPVVSDIPLSLLGHVKLGINVGSMSQNSKAQVLVARTVSQRSSPSRQTHETDTPDTAQHCDVTHQQPGSMRHDKSRENWRYSRVRRALQESRAALLSMDEQRITAEAFL